MKIRSKVVIALGLAGILGSSATASAQFVNFQGSSTGCFYTGAIFCGAGSNKSGGLVYSESKFNANSNTADGLFSLGDLAAVSGGNFNNLGSFALNGGGVDYTGKMFALFLTFTRPSGPNTNTYTSVLTGNTVLDPTGNVKVNFDNTDQNYAFTDGTKLSFHVNDVSFNNKADGSSLVAITGDGQVTTTPEPASLFLLGTGVIGMIPLVRRRKR